MPRRKAQQTRVLSQLAEVRVAKGVAQHELAHMVGISTKSLVRLEKHRLANPPLAWYVNCAIALGVELEDVLDEWQLRWKRLPGAPEPPKPGWIEELQSQR